MAKDKNKGKSAATEAPAAPKTYTTLSGVGEIEFIEKKSVFLGYACHVESEEEVLEIIKARRKEMPDATHHVYAYSMVSPRERRECRRWRASASRVRTTRWSLSRVISVVRCSAPAVWCVLTRIVPRLRCRRLAL